MPTQEEINRVIESTDMVELVSPYVKLTKQGKNYKGLCPFHNEDTPSFVVSQEKHLAHCFGCGHGGNPITFLMEIKQIGFNEALLELAQKAGISLTGLKRQAKKKDYKKFYDMFDVATKYYQKNLTTTKSGQQALQYLYKRGLTDETIKMFQIGLAPQKKDSLYRVLKEANYLELDMMDLGLIASDEQGYHDLFLRRIMFPIQDEQGNLIAFSGRILNQTDPSQPKYINTKETFLYRKGTVLYHLYLAKMDILKKKRVILHEGQMDVIASVIAGFNEAVCAMGTALSVEQAGILRKYTNQAVICYDGDKAGIAASLKAIAVFKQVGMTVHLVLLPDGMDPDEYIRKYGKEAYVAYFENHLLDEYQYRFETTFINKNLEDGSVLEACKQAIFEMVQTLSQTARERYLIRLSEKLKVSVDSISSDYNQYCRRFAPKQFVEDWKESDSYEFSVHPLTYQPPLKRNYELRLLMYAKSSKEIALKIDREIAPSLSAFDPIYQRIWTALVDDYYCRYSVFDESLFLNCLDEEQKSTYEEKIRTLSQSMDIYNERDLRDCMDKLKEQALTEKNKEYNKQIADSLDEAYIRKKIVEKFANVRLKDLEKIKKRRN